MTLNYQPNAGGTCSRECEQWYLKKFFNFDGQPASEYRCLELEREALCGREICPLAYRALLDVAKKGKNIGKDEFAWELFQRAMKAVPSVLLEDS